MSQKSAKAATMSVWRRFWNGISVEPIAACYMTAFTMVTLTVSNLNMQKACRVNLQLPDDTCEALVTKSTTGRQSDEVEVQKLVTSMMMWQTCAQNALPCVLMLLVGGWSDRTRKRVPCMLLPLYGELARNAGQLLCVYYFYQLPMEAAGIAETIPLALTGGQTLMTMTAYSYIGDATSVDQRTFRIGALNAILAVSMAIGTSLSGIVYNKLGFYGVYGLSSTLIIIGLIYGLLFVKDVTPVSEVNKNKSYRTTISEFLDFSHITQSFNTTFKKRPNDQRLRIIIVLIIFMASAGINAGYHTVCYLYTRVQFNWDEVQYSIFASYEIVMNILGLLFTSLFLSKQLKMSDEIIGMLSSISQTLGALFYIFAYNEFLFYKGPLVTIFTCAGNISTKSLMTKLVPKSELSQTAAVFGIAEIMVSLVFGLLYNGLYEITINFFPGSFYFITLILIAPTIALFLWLYVKRTNEYEYLNETNDVFQYKKSPRPKSKMLSSSNYGTIVEPLQN
ncbi:solute carrier family 46 member 3-like [Melanaphis sacchari]|uniref:solute carrier family 46 member 3-like n=1 Tax=Melanaphis sacchari TaxID=742174 RepID=UPI000DC158DB|nr:solute carrier family 46 member 3-like [Melanaphis sacchari]XP_025202487.1 solute carrier family 46 member 3-like [Melanaphis sacchari]XP_025202488.1 solute carrier family 46 member 3-like [Melanaphis sacchari]XP_025202489.1 solute carrier family 46 member 3-like [Melanaphis sacchari]